MALSECGSVSAQPSLNPLILVDCFGAVISVFLGFYPF